MKKRQITLKQFPVEATKDSEFADCWFATFEIYFCPQELNCKRRQEAVAILQKYNTGTAKMVKWIKEMKLIRSKKY